MFLNKNIKEYIRFTVNGKQKMCIYKRGTNEQIEGKGYTLTVITEQDGGATI